MTIKEIKEMVREELEYHMDEFGLAEEEAIESVADNIRYRYIHNELSHFELIAACNELDKYNCNIDVEELIELRHDYYNMSCIIKRHLERFIEAQDGGVYAQALKEIKNGHKESHWMWYIFPQLKGLGKSKTSNYFGIESVEEVFFYLDNEVLGKRLLEITLAVLNLKEKDIKKVFGRLDSLKLRSCMTLFYEVTKEDIFKDVLDKYFNGEEDPLTNELLIRGMEYEF